MWHEIRDPVHNFILFDDFEKRLIDSEPVQRLKHIKQLALTCEVYPGATHSRFEHSLGTMELATQAFDTIVRKQPDALKKLEWSGPDESVSRQVLRIGALLHDVGHAPFSHASQDLFPTEYKGHESFSEAFIRSDYIRPLLRKGPRNCDLEQVVAIALGPERKQEEDASLQLLQEIVAGELGVDRMDYLVRDALHSGAAAGRFDYHRLLNTLTVIEHPTSGTPVLAIEAGGLHAAEGLFLARYFMFLQVYFHDVRRIYDCHLRDFLSEYLADGHFPTQLDGYMKLTDDSVGAAIAEEAAGEGCLADLARRLRHGNHYRLADEITAQDKARDPEVFDKLTQYARDRFGDLVRTDEADKKAHTLDEGSLYVVHDDGAVRDILEESELILSLSLKPIWKGRLYAHRGVLVEVRKACREFLEGEGGPS
jgi:HD superfamily phosphohydrolase